MTFHVAVFTVALLTVSEFAVRQTERSRPGAQEREASTALDSEDLEPVLTRVSNLMNAGFSRSAARTLARRIAAQPLESERSYVYKVNYQGRAIRLRIAAYIDDVNTPDLYFFTTADAARAIQGQLEAYLKAKGQ